jgi:F0F1-type ATP synthase membrane subunit c/vacuolar-type H+-ATPase subunit K
LAGVEVALAAISTGLWAADSALEYTSTQAEYPQWQKDVQDTSFKLTGAVLSQLGTMGTATAVIDTEPITKGIAGGVSGICSALSYGILASRHYRALGNGKYATVLNKI